MELLVYGGPGAGERSKPEALASMSEMLPDLHARMIDSSELLAGEWLKSTALLVMPGGRDLLYCKKLNGKGNTLIRRYVEGGGRYLGFCAGAYFASSAVQFEIGTPNEVIGDRELAFFSGTAIGSVLKPGGFSYRNDESAQVAQLTDRFGHSLKVYFDGGCKFSDGKPGKILARYTDLPGQPAAAIHNQVGLGQVVLCGAHPEFSGPRCLTSRSDLAEELTPFEPARRQLLQLFIDSLFPEQPGAHSAG